MLILFAYLVYKVKDKYAVGGILVFIIVPIIGVLVSITVNPFFHQRFLIPAVGCLWLSFSVLLGKLYENKKIFYAILCVILIVGVIGCVDFINIQTQDANDTQTEIESLNNVIGSGNIIFNDFFPTYFELQGYMLENNHHLCFIDNITSNINASLNDPQIKQEIASGSKVYFIDGGHENIKELKKAGFIVKEIKFKQTIKNNEFKIYEIKI